MPRRGAVGRGGSMWPAAPVFAVGWPPTQVITPELFGRRRCGLRGDVGGGWKGVGGWSPDTPGQLQCKAQGGEPSQGRAGQQPQRGKTAAGWMQNRAPAGWARTNFNRKKSWEKEFSKSECFFRHVPLIYALGVLGSFYARTVGVKWPGPWFLKIKYFVMSNCSAIGFFHNHHLF